MKKLILIPALLLGAATALQAGSAAENWSKHCAKCHGDQGMGDTKIGEKLGLKDYSDPAVQEAMSDEEIFDATKNGVVVDGKTKMKGYDGKLSDEEITDLVAYIRGFKKEG